MRKNYVSIRDLSKVYRSPQGDIVALQGITVDIHETEFMSVLGPSGCGKSTLLRCVAGLTEPTSGSIRIDDRPVVGPPETLGMVFQRDVLLDWRTVIQNVLLPIEFRRLDPRQWEGQAKELLALLGLRGHEGRHPWELSGGMRQRVAICRALIQRPSLLLMDEPFGALDAMTRDELNLELQRIWMADAKTVIFVTHSIVEAVFLSDRVVVMSRTPGTIVEVFEVNLPRPRPLSIRETPEFGACVSHIRAIFEGLGMLQGG